jgi:glutathione S-transferase
MPQEVDTSLHPHTTGLASTLASQHASPSTSGLTLYGSWFCPFVQRVWILLVEKKIPHQYVEINPYKKEKHFLDLNPRGLVPTLAIAESVQPSRNAANGGVKKLNEKVLYESTVILDYLNEIHPSPPFYPSDPYDKARCKLWADHISSRIVPAFYRFLQHTPDKNYSLDSAREEFVRHIKTLVPEMDETGPFFTGSEMSMVDVILIPWAMRIFLLDHYKSSSGIPAEGKGGEDEKVWARWRKWFKAIEGRESVQRTLSDNERYVEVYQRYAEDTTGSQVGQATRGGRGLP